MTLLELSVEYRAHARALDFRISLSRVRGMRSTAYLKAWGLKDLASNLVLGIIQSSFLTK